jgi:hypothetical protein
MSAPYTKGPWAWFGNAGSNSLYLATTHSGRRYVMGFKRWGMRGAQPQFQPDGRGLVDASELLEFAVGNRDVRGVTQAKADTSVYRLDVTGIDCADARLIAAAPELVEALRGLLSLEIVATNSDEWERINVARALLARIEGGDA